MGMIIFGGLAVWDLSPDWFSLKLEVCDFFRRLGEAAAHGRGECGPCTDFSSYTLACVLQLRKNRGKPQSGSKKGSRLINAERDSFNRIGHRRRWPRLACSPLPPLTFASGDGVNTRSA